MAWFDSAVFYHMYPLGMVSAEKTNEDGPVRHRFPALTAYLPYLRTLGVNAVYIGPLFESGSHGYDTTDYRRIDRRLGSNADFRDFVDKAHALGIRVVVDAVFNHTGRGFFAFRDIQEKREMSSYRDWYKGVNFGWGSPKGDSFGYSAWRGAWELPELNFANAAVREYLLSTVDFWVREFDIDGLRLDCADVLDLSFQKDLRRRAADWKPDFWLMGEVIHGEYARWVNPETLHSVTNYELHKSIYSGFNSHNFFEIAHNLRRNLQIAGSLYTFLENHDVDRLPDKLENQAHLPLCYLTMFTLPGHPSLYYGGEFGMRGRKRDGWDDSPMRPPISDPAMAPNALTEYMAALCEAHQEHPALQRGEYRELLLRCGQWAYARVLEGAESILVVLNNEDRAEDIGITLPAGGGLCRELLTGETWRAENGVLHLQLPGNTGYLISVEKDNN